MDEQTIQLSLETYRSQLSQVEGALLASGEENSPDLVQLRGDLKELIQLTESSLLSLKKSNLLRELENVGTTSNDMDDEFAAFQAAIAEESIDSNVSQEPGTSNHFSKEPPSSEDSSQQSENLNYSDDVTGMKCRAPYTPEWGRLQYHNALVLSMEPLTENSTEPKIRVVFCNPTHCSMVVCPYFLEGKCRFDEDDCRFSHGQTVNVADLKEFSEPDYSSLQKGATCLARYRDDVWYEATIKKVLEDHKFEIKYETYNETQVVDMEDVFPREARQDDVDSSSDSDTDDVKITPLNDESSDEENALPVFLWKPPQTTQALGEWESHTKGIGSKLMAKMGYITGQGLGRNGEGRAEPVPIRLLPPGKSLDKVMELKEIAGDRCLIDVMKRHRKKKKTQENSMAQGYELKKEKPNVFDFINKKLHGKKADIHSLLKPHNTSKKGKEVKHITEKDLKKKSEKNVNIQLLQTHEEIRNVDRKLAKLQESLGRNEGRDPGMVKQLKQKIASLEKYKEQLNHSERSISKHKTMRNEHKKLTIF